MTDYIERDRLMPEIEKSVEAAVQDGNLVVADAFETMRDLVYAFPAADVKPVVRGRWFGGEYDGYADGAPVFDTLICSECGAEYDADIADSANFCPNCGAEMVTGCNQLEEDEG